MEVVVIAGKRELALVTRQTCANVVTEHFAGGQMTTTWCAKSRSEARETHAEEARHHFKISVFSTVSAQLKFRPHIFTAFETQVVSGVQATSLSESIGSADRAKEPFMRQLHVCMTWSVTQRMR